MTSKKDVAKSLHDFWTSKYGQVNLEGPKPDSKLNGVDNENGNLFTGEACVLTKMNAVQTKDMIDDYVKSFMATRIEAGLYSRRPKVENDENYHIVSHDEYNGLMYMWTMIPEYRYLADEVVEYGKNHNWQFIDGDPGADGLVFFRKNIFKSIGVIFKLVSLWITGKMSEFRELRRNSRPLSYILKIMRPRDRAFFKLVSLKYKPSFIEILDLVISIIVASYKPKEDTSGKKIIWFRMLCIDRLQFKLGFFSKRLLAFSHRFFVKKMLKQYGFYPLNEIMKIYYKENHPFIKLSEGY